MLEGAGGGQARGEGQAGGAAGPWPVGRDRGEQALERDPTGAEAMSERDLALSWFALGVAVVLALLLALTAGGRAAVCR